jgi:hypothetical protein
LKETGYLIFKEFPILFLFFREAYMKFGFGFVLALIILFCYCVQQIFKIKTFSRYNFLKVALFLLVLFPVIYWTFPFFLGNFIPTQIKVGNLHTFSAFTDEPYRYSPVISYLKQDKDVVNGNVRILVYPLSIHSLWGLCYRNAYWGNDILRFAGISTISTISHINFENETNFLRNLYDINFLQDQNYVNTISRMGVKYVLIQKQPCPNGMIIAGWTKSQEQNDENTWHNLSKTLEDKIDKMPLIKKIMEKDEYSLFEISTKKIGSISLVRGSSSFDPAISKKINFLNTTYSSNQFPLQQLIQPQYEKISSTEYTINIKDLAQPFYIVFTESYDNGWKAFVDEKEQIPDKYHFMINDFANGWYINKTGSFNIKLYFEPQKYYEIGLMIYVIVWSSCLLYFFMERKKVVKETLRGKLYKSPIVGDFPE